MTKGDSYAVPEAKAMRDEGRDAFAEIWRAEKYMHAKKIDGDSEMITWFVRGSADNVVRWHMENERLMSSWLVFKREFIMKFGTPENKREAARLVKQESRSISEYVQLIVELVTSDPALPFAMRDAINAIAGLEDLEVRTLLVKQLYKKPKEMPYAVWLVEIARRMERKMNAAKRLEEEKIGLRIMNCTVGAAKNDSRAN
ncbi:hypothetical protein PAPHI01_1985 [Pancytospora philotis]|nr:hypothetical protein PAPHI01_1985 [Pancytospora philotis]